MTFPSNKSYIIVLAFVSCEHGVQRLQFKLVCFALRMAYAPNHHTQLLDRLKCKHQLFEQE